MDAEEQWHLLLDLVGVVGRGGWRAVVRPPGLRSRVVGSRDAVRWALALELVARSMQLQAQGDLLGAWGRLGEAVTLLPRQLVRHDAATGTPLALLPPRAPETAPVEQRVVVGLARLMWREQTELVDLRQRFACGRMKARDELVEGCILYFIWVQHDPTTYFRTPAGEVAWDDGVAVEPSRTVLCLFGTGVRWFADPARCTTVTQSVWQDIGAYRGLAAEALDRLAGRPMPATWCGAPGTSGLVVRRGRLRAWQYARRRGEDLDPL
jgi:hypothetical protein